MEHDQRRPAGALAQQRGDPARVLGVGGDHQAAGVGVPAAPQRRELGVGLAQDPRQAVGQLGRDRGPVTASGLAARQHGLEARLDHVVAAAPRQRPVVGDEADRPADRLARPRRRRCRSSRARRARRRRSGRPGSRSRPSETACRTAAATAGTSPNAVANDSPHASSSPRWWASSAITSDVRGSAPAHRRGALAIRAYVTDDAVKALGGRGESASGASSIPSAAAARAHCRVSGAVGQATTTRPDRPGGELVAGELERRPRLARAGRGRQQKRTVGPLRHRRQRAVLPRAQWALRGV